MFFKNIRLVSDENNIITDANDKRNNKEEQLNEIFSTA